MPLANKGGLSYTHGGQFWILQVVTVPAQILSKSALLSSCESAINSTVLKFASLHERSKDTWQSTLDFMKVKLWLHKYPS